MNKVLRKIGTLPDPPGPSPTILAYPRDHLIGFKLLFGATFLGDIMPQNCNHLTL